MAHGIVDVSKSHPCPICGKPDWCGWLPPLDEDSAKAILCMRDTTKESQVGYDGENYVYLRDSGEGNSIFMEFGAYERRQKIRAKHRSTTQDKNALKFKKAEEFQRCAPKSIHPVNILEPKDARELDTIYRYMVSLLALKPEHRKYLYSQGWTDEMINYYHVVSFPESDTLRKRFNRKDINPERAEIARRIVNKFGEESLLGVPGFYKEKEKGGWTIFGPSGLLFPMFDIHGNMYRMRIRMDFRDQKCKIFSSVTDSDDYIEINNERHYLCMKGVYRMNGWKKEFIESRGKYRTLSSYIEDDEERQKGFLKNKLDCGTRSGNVISCYRPEKYDTDMLIITEGEPKGAYTAMKLGMEVWTLPGVNSWSLILDEEKVETIKNNDTCVLVAFDADKATNDNVLKMEKDLISNLMDAGIPVMKLEWNMENGKGIDDNLAVGGSIRFVSV